MLWVSSIEAHAQVCHNSCWHCTVTTQVSTKIRNSCISFGVERRRQHKRCPPKLLPPSPHRSHAHTPFCLHPALQLHTAACHHGEDVLFGLEVAEGTSANPTIDLNVFALPTHGSHMHVPSCSFCTPQCTLQHAGTSQHTQTLMSAHPMTPQNNGKLQKSSLLSVMVPLVLASLLPQPSCAIHPKLRLQTAACHHGEAGPAAGAVQGRQQRCRWCNKHAWQGEHAECSDYRW